MAFNELTKNVQHLNENTQELIERNLEYYKLSIFKKITKLLSSMVKFLIIGAVLSLAGFMLSLAIARALADWIDNIAVAYLIVGGVYILLALFIYFVFGKTIEKSILIKASKVFFD